MESDGREVATHGQCCGTEEKSAQSAPSVVSTGGGRSAGWLLCLSKRAAGLENEPTRTLVHTRPDARRDRGRLIPPLGGWPCLARFQGKRQRALVYVPRPLCVSVSAPVCVCVCARMSLWHGMGGRRSANGIQPLTRIHRVEQQPFPAKRTDELCDWRAMATLHGPLRAPLHAAPQPFVCICH